MEVGDIYDYMEGLSKYKVGDTTPVKVIRGEETLEFDVTF
jgi:S1-C subfamily serine protease